MRFIIVISGRLISFLFSIWQIRNATIKFKKYHFLSQSFQAAYDYILKSYGSWISIDAKLEEIPLFPHEIFGVFISGGSVIGKNAIIFQHVTIGSNTLVDSKRIGAPTIGDNCYIGAGAKIIGDVKIGNNCRIGANCVVYEDMPDNSVAVLAPTRIIQKSMLNNKFYKRNESNWYFYNSGKWVFDPNFK